MTDGPVYHDENDPNIVMVQLNVENLDKAMGWFKATVVRAGNVSRNFWFAHTKA